MIYCVTIHIEIPTYVQLNSNDIQKMFLKQDIFSAKNFQRWFLPKPTGKVDLHIKMCFQTHFFDILPYCILEL